MLVSLIISPTDQRSKVGLSWLLGLDLGSICEQNVDAIRIYPCMTIRGIHVYIYRLYNMCKFRSGHLIMLGPLCVLIVMQAALDLLQNDAKHNDVM